MMYAVQKRLRTVAPTQKNEICCISSTGKVLAFFSKLDFLAREKGGVELRRVKDRYEPRLSFSPEF